MTFRCLLFAPQPNLGALITHSYWAKSSIDVGKIHSAPSIKIQRDPLKPLPRISQPISKEAIQGIKSVRGDYKTQGLHCPLH